MKIRHMAIGALLLLAGCGSAPDDEGASAGAVALVSLAPVRVAAIAETVTL